jgi:hypothetical protein
MTLKWDKGKKAMKLEAPTMVARSYPIRKPAHIFSEKAITTFDVNW